MAILIVVASLLFIYGSFLMVRPSERDRRTARLRQKAIELGLQVRLSSRLKLAQELSRPDMVCLILNRPKEEEGLIGSCFRNPENLRLKSFGALSRFDKELSELFSHVPSGTEAWVSTDSYVGVCWDEKGQEEDVESLALQLPKLINLTAS